MDPEERRAWLALNSLPGLGPGCLNDLLQRAGSLAAVVAQPELWPPHPARRPAGWSRDALRERGHSEERALLACGARALLACQPDYPSVLRQLDHPPPVLALRGETAALREARLRLAVVGARACTPYGSAQAARFGCGLAASGAVVVSGAARGIDQAAMRGALEAGGQVVAVLGGGMDRPYPPEAGALLDAIVAAGGAVLSEFPCGSKPARGNFPRRNRILAALARAVLVVQATEKSGSMITVGWALELGRDVFAVPGSVDCTASRGPHQLLREGAMLAESPAEVLAHYDTPAAPGHAPGDSPLLAVLAEGGKDLDQLAAELQRPAEDLQLELVELELRGLLTRLAGGIYHRTHPGQCR